MRPVENGTIGRARVRPEDRHDWLKQDEIKRSSKMAGIFHKLHERDNIATPMVTNHDRSGMTYVCDGEGGDDDAEDWVSRVDAFQVRLEIKTKQKRYNK